MRRSLLALSLLAGLGAPVLAVTATLPAQSKAGARSVWIVHFDEEPLASYRGGPIAGSAKLGALAATSPAATGETRLDVGSPASRAYRSALASLREERLMQASARIGRTLEPLFVYDVATYGMAVEMTEAEARALSGIDGVASVAPEFVREPATDSGPRWIKANTLWSQPGGSGNSNQGEGKIVGIIDTGINALHRSFNAGSIQNPRSGYLGLCATSTTAGCNNKLIGIYDHTTGSGDNAGAEANDGGDPNGHGTHVAATAAGNSVSVSLTSGTYTLSGVAPKANIISYKACEVEAKCRGSWTLAAIDQAVVDKVDVINYSIGGDERDPWRYTDTMAMLKAREAGIVVVVAAGNEGPRPSTHTAPGNSPWVIGVANVSHDRANVSRVTLSGGASTPPGNGTLLGAGLTSTAYGPASIVYGGDYGSALCATGPNVDALPPSTATSPWTGQPFAGQVVICDRGIYARVIKGLNVKNAGGGGMLLVNQAGEGDALVADSHELPASHLGYADGVALKTWLASGSGHTARIERSTVERLAAFGDVLASSSGRGPVDGDWLKPNLAAPGSNILAAYKSVDGNAQQFAYMSGTSMATPHVAGAALLLRKAHPDWGPSQVESALQTTARASVRLPDGVTPATVADAGAGTIDVSKAVRAALYFPVSGTEFRNANPSTGGIPRNLNLPSLVDGHCFVSCTFTRTVQDMGGGGTWRVVGAMPNGALSVSPAEFTIASGGSQTLVFTYTPGSSVTHGRWLDGTVTMTRTGGNAPDVVLPVTIRPSAGTLPSVVALSGSGDQGIGESGWHDVAISGVVALPSARFAGSDLVQPLVARPTVPQDTTRDDRYDGLNSTHEGTRFFRLTATHTGRVRFRAEARSTTSPDIDLFIGAAASASALPTEATELCASTSPASDEVCDIELDVTAGDRFWVLVQNWQSSPAGSDAVSLSTALVPLAASTAAAEARTLIASGPGRTALNDAFKVRVGWNDPGFAHGESRWGHLLIGANDTDPASVGAVLVKLDRSSDAPSASALLFSGVKRTMRLAPGKAQDRLYIDVPPNATRLSVSSQGQGEVTLHLAESDWIETTPVPGVDPSPAWIPPAPARDQADASSNQSGANDSVSVSFSGPGGYSRRWYVTPENTGSTAAQFDLTATIEYGSAAVRPNFGNWYNPRRSGSGFLLSPYGDGGIWVVAWYAYLQDGTPTWYLGTGSAPTGTRGHVNFDVNRYAWNGSRAVATLVGQATLSLESASGLRFNWNLDGEAGSTRVTHIASSGCQALQGQQQPDGNWDGPTTSGFGYDINAYPGLESILSYLYDSLGQPRWVQASRGQNPSIGADASMDVVQRNGACPICFYQGGYTATPVGALTRRYLTPTTGRLSIDVDFAGEVPGTWSVDGDIGMLTAPRSCD